MEKTEKDYEKAIFMTLLFAILAGITFGLWVGDLFAGLFAFCLIGYIQYKF